jgi:hypothetical protein
MLGVGAIGRNERGMKIYLEGTNCVQKPDYQVEHFKIESYA